MATMLADLISTELSGDPILPVANLCMLGLNIFVISVLLTLLALGWRCYRKGFRGKRVGT